VSGDFSSVSEFSVDNYRSGSHIGLKSPLPSPSIYSSSSRGHIFSSTNSSLRSDNTAVPTELTLPATEESLESYHKLEGPAYPYSGHSGHSSFQSSNHTALDIQNTTASRHSLLQNLGNTSRGASDDVPLADNISASPMPSIHVLPPLLPETAHHNVSVQAPFAKKTAFNGDLFPTFPSLYSVPLLPQTDLGRSRSFNHETGSRIKNTLRPSRSSAQFPPTS
jgi:hypothetical protein